MSTPRERTPQEIDQNRLKFLDEINLLAKRKHVDKQISKENETYLNNLLRVCQLKIITLNIKGDEIFNPEGAVIPEFAYLRGKVAPFTAFHKGKLQVAPAHKKGKRSVVSDMLYDSLNTLPSLRGQTLYAIVDQAQASAEGEYDVAALKRAAMLASEKRVDEDETDKLSHPHLVDQRSVIGRLLVQCCSRFRGLPDALNLFAWANFIISRALMVTELSLYTVGALLSNPFYKARNKFIESDSTGGKIFYGALAALVFGLPYLASFIPSFVADACRYTRHVVDSVSNLVSSAFAKIGDKIFGTENYAVKYPTYRVSGENLLKNLLYLIPTAIIIGLSFIPGLQFVPAAAKAATKFFSWFFMSVSTSVLAKMASGATRDLLNSPQATKKEKRSSNSPSIQRKLSDSRKASNTPVEMLNGKSSGAQPSNGSSQRAHDFAHNDGVHVMTGSGIHPITGKHVEHHDEEGDGRTSPQNTADHNNHSLK